MITQSPLTLIAPVLPHKLSDLRRLLAMMASSPGTNCILPFGRIERIHFGRVVILDGFGPGDLAGLSMETNYDGEEEAHLTDLIRVAGPGLTRLFSHCEGFMGDIPTFIKTHQLPVAAFYNGHRGRSHEQIRREEDLRQAIRTYLDTHSRSLEGLTQRVIQQRIQQYITAQPAFAWAVRNKGNSMVSEWIAQRWQALAIGCGVLLFLCLACSVSIWLVVSILLIIAGIIRWWLGALNRHEATDNPRKIIADEKRVAELLNQENLLMQNQLTHVATLKPGSLRRRSLKVVLWSINLLARVWFNRGKLGGIPTIHFARWVFLDNDRRLLFYSNFDGSWESYLGDFTDKSARGLTAIWSNTVDFPKAHNLIQAGATNEQRFKEWTRSCQLPTQVWYSAYPDLSVSNINTNSRIRAGLFRWMPDYALTRWFRRL